MAYLKDQIITRNREFLFGFWSNRSGTRAGYQTPTINREATINREVALGGDGSNPRDVGERRVEGRENADGVVNTGGGSHFAPSKTPLKCSF